MSTDETPADIIRELAGGPAFPQPEIHSGMSLLDYFAGEALKPMLARVLNDHDPNSVPDDLIALRAYKMAAAMLKARRERIETAVPA